MDYNGLVLEKCYYCGGEGSRRGHVCCSCMGTGVLLLDTYAYCYVPTNELHAHYEVR